MRARLLGLLVLLAGCTGPSPAAPLLVFKGGGCTEVGLLLPGDLGAARALVPEALRPREARDVDPGLPPDRSLAVVAFNHCTFDAEPAARTPEAFVWVAVEPPARLLLRNNASHMFEALHWRPPGAGLDALRRALPAVEEAAIEGLAGGFQRGASFNASVRTGAGDLAMEGQAAEPTQVARWPEGLCCRTFAPGREGLVRIDYASTDQPQGEARCALRTSIASLVALLGAAEGEGRCVHNAGYDFTAEVRAAGSPAADRPRKPLSRAAR